MNISTTVVPSHYHFFETSSLEPFSLFYDLIATYYTKRKWQWRQDYVFCLESFHFDKTMFFTSAYFSPSDLKSRLKQKLSSLKPKFCFYDGHINVSIFSNVIRLQLPWEQQKSDLGTSLTYFWHKNERKISLNFIFVFEHLRFWHTRSSFLLSKFASRKQKRHPGTGVNFTKIFKTSYFYRTPGVATSKNLVCRIEIWLLL